MVPDKPEKITAGGTFQEFMHYYHDYHE